MTKFFTLYKAFILCPLLLCFFFTTSSFAQWTRKADALKTRYEVPSVVYKGKYYTFLGFADPELHVAASSEVYDPATNKWTLLSSIPSGKAVTHHGVVQVDDMVWHIGGRVGTHPGPLTSETWIYNITSNTWTPGPQIMDPATGKPLLWGGGGAAMLGRTLHVFGGFVNDACNDDQDRYHLTLDVDEWLANKQQPPRWKNVLAPMPVKRNQFGTVVLGGKIYAIGGQFGHDCGGGHDKQYCHVYNPETNAWTELPLLPIARSHFESSCFAIDGKIYVVAGQTANNVNVNKVTIFDPAANNGAGAWKDDTTLTLPTVYEGLAAKVINNTFIISHGGAGSYRATRKTTYTRTLSRKPVYKLGFLPACANVQAGLQENINVKTRLFTIDGSKEYVTSSNASWLKVTKNATGTAIQNAVDIEATINTSGLAPGTYHGKITATGTGTGTAYASAEYCVTLTVPAPTVLEAENAVLYRAVVANNHTGYTGSGFADFINSSGDYVEWTVNRTASQSASLRFRYANGSSASRPLKLEVNGVVVAASLSFPPTGGWSNWSTASVTANLVSGANKIRLTAIGQSGANIDNLAYSAVATTRRTAYLESQRSEPTFADGFNVSVAPNPAKGVVNLLWTNVSDAAVEIAVADAGGNIRRTFVVQPGNNGRLAFSVSTLPNGLYVISARQGKQKAFTKVFVQNN